MGLAYFISLDKSDPNFDPFVSGKFIAQDAKRLSKVAASLGLKSFEDYGWVSGGSAADLLGEDFDIDDIQTPPERWFDAEEGLTWVAALRAKIQADEKVVKNAKGVLFDLAEYERVLSHAKSIGAKWHLSIDF